MNDLEGVPYDVGGSSLLSSAHSGAHEIVDKPLDNVNFSLAKPSMLMSSHAMRDVNWLKRDVPLEPEVFNLDASKTPLFEKLDLFSLAQVLSP